MEYGVMDKHLHTLLEPEMHRINTGVKYFPQMRWGIGEWQDLASGFYIATKMIL